MYVYLYLYGYVVINNVHTKINVRKSPSKISVKNANPSELLFM